jgi:hypothetical protein
MEQATCPLGSSKISRIRVLEVEDVGPQVVLEGTSVID